MRCRRRGVASSLLQKGEGFCFYVPLLRGGGKKKIGAVHLKERQSYRRAPE